MAVTIDPQAARQFAVEVVRTLRDAGFEALWAGGCVRDQLIGREPKDYDVATDARPEQVRDVFGRQRSLPIGAAFGVITVLGTRASGPIEVATFRSDADYSDGRRPDGIVFTNAENDARRRDFTINGLFFDPLENRLIDYVGGREDLQQGVIRAIGDAGERIGEDKLRMLRAVRFAATFDFSIDASTAEAIRDSAADIVIVSAERIAEELRRMLVHAHRRRAAELLAETRLLHHILPELALSLGSSLDDREAGPWRQTLDLLASQVEPPFFSALTGLCFFGLQRSGDAFTLARAIAVRLKLTNAESRGIEHLLKYETPIRAAATWPWPLIQRILALSRAAELVQFASDVSAIQNGDPESIEFCRAKLALPTDVLNPPPLISGDDLRDAGLSPGPAFRDILEQVRDLQLMGQLSDAGDALQWVKERWPELFSP
ncbi:MAG: CCA tRNA nucleotidyltransferase [Pirellulaceae bacterium]|jgi:tRNA nucleotidyltransferase/poly(A) polymerase|nr:CCA tRNA nucleotidyltransferase [Pirellulaceae bacterium]MDP7017152.1 CCA tRNA nucleotidyltransferase [Pirellulaceae bacterium]